MPFLPWMINANHGPSINSPHHRDLHALEVMSAPVKTKDLSVFCSTQSRTPEHRMRFHFVEQLKEHFGDRLDWFGNGVNPVDEKWEGLAPYRSTIVLENRSTSWVITEKLADAYLAFSYPFYWGASNVGDFVPAGSFTPINIHDFEGSIALIERDLAEGTPEARAQEILLARQWVLSEWNPYARMADIAEDVLAASGGVREKRALRTMASAQPVSMGLRSRLHSWGLGRRSHG